MNNKKIYAIMCAGLFLFSLLGIAQAQNPPASPYSAYGYVTINGNSAPAGIEIILSIDDRVDRIDLTNANGQYTIDFESMSGETAKFSVRIGNQFFVPTTNPLFHIEQASPYGYYLNLTVEASSIPPIADAGGPYYAQINQLITFSGAGSMDLDGTITGYRWDWTNDGTWDTTWLSTPTTTHSYSNLGIYTVKLEVQDNNGATDDDTATATITTEPPQNNPPYTPSNPYPQNNAINQSIFVDLAWTGGDQDSGDTVTYQIYFGTNINPALYDTTSTYPASQTSLSYTLPTLEKNTQYYWKIIAIDNHGASTTGPIWNFMTVPLGDNVAPSKVTGFTVTDSKDGKLSLSWNPATDNVAVDHYKIFRNNVFIQNTSSTTYLDTGLTNGQTYTYKISAVDTSGNEGAASDPASGTPTATQSVGGGGGVGGEQPLENKKPIADTSRGAPYRGFVNSPIVFDGSASIDPDGTIISWKWTFGDGTNGSGKTVSHIYTSIGSYTVILTVTDNGSATDTDETTAIIAKANNPPTNPIINGPAIGTKNTNYDYTIQSTDADSGDTIKYIVSWGDGQTNTTDFFASGIPATASHTWTAAGRYVISVKASDNKTESGTTTHAILIDAQCVDGYGYLIDTNGDGIYDQFYSNTTELLTAVELQVNGTYLINSDSDNDWDWIYDPTTETLTAYTTSEGEPQVAGADNIIWYALVIGMILALLFILIIFLATKKKKGKK